VSEDMKIPDKFSNDSGKTKRTKNDLILPLFPLNLPLMLKEISNIKVHYSLRNTDFLENKKKNQKEYFYISPLNFIKVFFIEYPSYFTQKTQ
jgi:hypothetical protein